MIWIKKQTKNTAILYLSKEEEDNLGIRWINEFQGYQIENKGEEERTFHLVDQALGYKSFGYDIARVSDEEKEMLRELGVEGDIKYSVFIKRNDRPNPVATLIRYLKKEENENEETEEKDIISPITPSRIDMSGALQG